MPHWSCHYYRLETNSSFVVGDWEYTVLDSLVFMTIYSALVIANLFSIVKDKISFIVALISGVCHIILAILHLTRLIDPFDFIVFGYQWSENASIREVLIVGTFGLISLYFSYLIKFNKIK